MRRNRSLIVLSGLVTLAIALSGCIKMDMKMKVKENEKIDGTVLIAFSEQMLTMMGQKKEDFFKDMNKNQKDLPKGAKTEKYDKDGFVGQKISFTDMPATEFAKTTKSAAGPQSTSSDSKDDMALVKDGENWKFTGGMDFSGSGLGGLTDTKPPKGAKTTKAVGPDMSVLMKGLSVKIEMTFPGKIIKTDKDAKVKGKTVTWEPKAGQNVQMLAIAARK